MSSFPARSLEIWRSSIAESMSPISEAFSFEVLHTVMVPQTLQFLAEKALRGTYTQGEVISGAGGVVDLAPLHEPAAPSLPLVCRRMSGRLSTSSSSRGTTLIVS
jgi:hypothetical protein